MATKAAGKTKKTTERRERGVYLREDGRPRYELKVRWTQKDGTRAYLPTRVFPFDPNARTGPTCRQHALDSANKAAIEERAALRLHDKPRSQLSEAWTFGGLLERLIEELTPTIEAIEAEGGNTKHLRLKVSYARMLLGRADRKHTGNPEGFPDLCAKTVTSLNPSHFSGKDAPWSLAARLKGKDGKPAPADSVRRLMSFLSWLFQHAKSAWAIDVANPIARWKELDLPPSNRGRERTLKDDEWRRVEAALGSAWPSTQVAIYTARFTAARRAEVVKLDWEDLSLDGKHATALLRDTKSKHKNKQGAEAKNRSIPIPESVAKKLRELRDTMGGKDAKGPVFVGQLGTRLGADTLTQAWNRACAKAKVKGARLHDLRHTRITELGHTLNNPLQVAAISGHEDLGVLKRYFNASAEDLAALLHKIESEKRGERVHDGDLGRAIEALLPLSPDKMIEALARAQALKLQQA